MTLINEMLNNLKNQRPEGANTKGQGYKTPASTSPYRGRNRGLFIALAVIVSVSAIIGVTYNYLPHHYRSAGKVLASAFKASVSMNGIGKNQNNIQYLYYRAVNNLNEGNVDQALAELKIILDKEPQFSPAKTTYQKIISNY